MTGPPDERRGRPADTGAAPSKIALDDDTDSVAPERSDAEQAPPPTQLERFSLEHVNRIRRISRDLDELLREIHPARFALPPPSDFGLTNGELAAEANRLHRVGWTIEEIRAVLAVPEPAAGGLPTGGGGGQSSSEHSERTSPTSTDRASCSAFDRSALR